MRLVTLEWVRRDSLAVMLPMVRGMTLEIDAGALDDRSGDGV